MLVKLLKYDLKNIYKVLIIFYVLAIFFAVLTRVFFSVENSFIMTVIANVCSGVTISMLFNILINNLMRHWVRFKHNLYGDESYLTHSLPVKKGTIYCSKAISSVITLFTSVAVIGLTLFIAYYSKENIQILKSMLLPVADVYGSTIIKILLAILFIFFLEFANALQAGYTGIILGHKMAGAKTGFSVLFGFISYMATQIFVLMAVYIAGIFNSDIMNLFNTNTIINVDIIKVIIYLAMAIYTLALIIVYGINVKLLKNGVNVD